MRVDGLLQKDSTRFGTKRPIRCIIVKQQVSTALERIVNGDRVTRVLVLSTVFPSIADPTRGVFVKERMKALAAMDGFDVRVIAPVPWFPPVRAFGKWYQWSQYPHEEVVDGLMTYHPRYILPPKIGGYFHSDLMFTAVRKTAERIRAEFAFDIVDAHWVYPSGVTATKLAKHFGVRAAMTGRGEDMLRFPSLPLVGARIRWALQNADCCIGVSNEIAEAMRANGADPIKTVVIANGVDTEKFKRLPQRNCRERLKLPLDKKILISIGDRLELKGFHLLVDAMPAILERHRDAFLVVVGGPGRFGRDYTDQIKARIDENNVQHAVLLAGPQPHESIVDWYNAADLFALMSSREGSPNVLLEALACGTPVVGTPVGGIFDELSNPTLGSVLAERSSEAAAETISMALSKDWDRQKIRSVMEARSWQATATKLSQVLRTTAGTG